MRKRGAIPIFAILAASFFFVNCKNASEPEEEPPPQTEGQLTSSASQ